MQTPTAHTYMPEFIVDSQLIGKQAGPMSFGFVTTVPFGSYGARRIESQCATMIPG